MPPKKKDLRTVAATIRKTQLPARGGLARVGIARTELVVGLDSPHQSDHGADGVDQSHGGFEIALDHRLGLDKARRAIPLRIGSGRSQGYS